MRGTPPVPLALALSFVLACSSDPGADDADAEATEDSDSTEDESAEDSEGGGLPQAPHAEVLVVSTTLPESGDPCEVYYPADTAGLPLAVLLQGAEVPRGYYEPYARAVAAWGFMVAVPDHEGESVLGQGLYASPRTLSEALVHITALASDPDSELYERLDADKMAALGHSYGGVAGLQGMTGQCAFPICEGEYTPPQALRAGVFYGTNLAPPFPTEDPIPPTPNMDKAIALIQGSLDSLATVAETVETWEAIETPPKLYVEIDGANHHGLLSEDNPAESAPDPETPLLGQAASIETSARWTGLFLRAHLLDDTQAHAWVHADGDAADDSVMVQSLP